MNGLLFDLRLALHWLSGFPPAGLPPQGARYEAAHTLGGRPRLLRLAATAPGHLQLTVLGDHLDAADEGAAAALVSRVFSLDRDPSEFYAGFAHQLSEHKEMLVAVSLLFYGLLRSPAARRAESTEAR